MRLVGRRLSDQGAEEGEECVVKIRGNPGKTNKARELVVAVFGDQENPAPVFPGLPA